jgi:thioredoxin reductase (NADPH)
MEESTFLTKFAEKVYVLHRRDELRASKIMQERAFENEKIEFVWNTEVVDVLGENQVEGIEVINNETGETRVMDEVTGLFLAIGHTPNTDPFTGWLDTDDNGYIITRPDSTYTNVPGVFASGDAQDHEYRQAVTAAGTGCMAAIDAERWLAENGRVEPASARTASQPATAKP